MSPYLKYSFQRVRLIIPAGLLLVVGIHFMQRSAAQAQVPPSQTKAPAKDTAPKVLAVPELKTKPASRWHSSWKRIFSPYEVALKRPLTFEEQQGIALAYRSYRQNVAGVLGMKLSELARKEREVTRIAMPVKPKEPIK